MSLSFIFFYLETIYQCHLHSGKSTTITTYFHVYLRLLWQFGDNIWAFNLHLHKRYFNQSICTFQKVTSFESETQKLVLSANMQTANQCFHAECLQAVKIRSYQTFCTHISNLVLLRIDFWLDIKWKIYKKLLNWTTILFNLTDDPVHTQQSTTLYGKPFHHYKNNTPETTSSNDKPKQNK